MPRTDYLDYEFDLAGSRSKNRFRFEIFWGLSKFLEVVRTSDDFTMVFDYVCDVEVHYPDNYEFYQVKTSSGVSYPISRLVNKGTKRNSIIGTLYKIRSTDIQKMSNLSKLALVSNLPLEDSNAPTNANIEFLFLDSLQKNKEKIMKALKEEFPDSEINLNNIVFIRADLTPDNYRELMIGKVDTYYQEIYGHEALKPAALLNVLSEEAQYKADYEYALSNHDEVLEKKGLSKNRFEVILEMFSERAFSEAQRCRDEVKKVEKSLKKIREYSIEIPKLIAEVRKNFFLTSLVEEIKTELIDRIDDFSDGEFLDYARLFLKKTPIVFPIEYNTVQKEILILLSLIKLEEDII